MEEGDGIPGRGNYQGKDFETCTNCVCVKIRKTNKAGRGREGENGGSEMGGKGRKPATGIL